MSQTWEKKEPFSWRGSKTRRIGSEAEEMRGRALRFAARKLRRTERAEMVLVTCAREERRL